MYLRERAPWEQWGYPLCSLAVCCPCRFALPMRAKADRMTVPDLPCRRLIGMASSAADKCRAPAPTWC